MQFPGTTIVVRVSRMLAATLLVAPALALCAATGASAAPALSGQWRFDEGAGQVAIDDGPRALHGVLGASSGTDAADPLRVAGASGGGLRFGGSSYVSVADARRLDLPTLTVEAVARAQGSPGAHRYLVSHGSRDCIAGSYGLYTGRDGGLSFYVFDGERYYVSPSARPADVWDGGWHRVTGTFDGSVVRAFVDGREIGASRSVPQGTAIEYESMPLGTYFGNYVGGCRLPFGGELDSVRIWTQAQSAQAVAEQAGAPRGSRPAPLTALTPGSILDGEPPKASCAVSASRTRIATRRRSVVTLRATSRSGRPLRRVRLAVKRAGSRRVLAARRTNSRGSVRLALRVTHSGRLRVAVVGRKGCTPAFIRVAGRTVSAQRLSSGTRAPAAIAGTSLRKGDRLPARSQLVYRDVELKAGQSRTLTIRAPSGRRILGTAARTTSELRVRLLVRGRSKARIRVSVPRTAPNGRFRGRLYGLVR